MGVHIQIYRLLTYFLRYIDNAHNQKTWISCSYYSSFSKYWKEVLCIVWIVY